MRTEWIIYPEDTSLFYSNGVKLGDVLCDVDGEYKFFPVPERGGYWDALVMRQIADFVDALNVPHAARLDQYMRSTKHDREG